MREAFILSLILILVILLPLKSLCYNSFYQRIIAPVESEKKSIPPKDTVISNIPVQIFQVKTISGKEWNNANLRNKIVVLNFWFIACAPCRSELPLINEVASEYKNDTSIVFISISTMDDSSQLLFVKKHWHIKYQMVPHRIDICQAFHIEEYPTNLILYKDKVAFKAVGYHPDIDKRLTAIINEIKQHVGGHRPEYDSQN